MVAGLFSKRNLMLAAAVFAVAVACAQPNPIRVGFSGGVIWQDADFGTGSVGGYRLTAESNVGGYAGLNARIDARKFSILPEINYTFNSYDLRADNGSLSSSSRVKVNSVEVPILFEKRFLQLFRIQLGPVFNLWSETTTGVVSGDQAAAPMVMSTRSALGYMVGLSVSLGGKFSLTGRYGGDFAKQKQAVSIGGQTAYIHPRVSSLSLSVGIKL